MEFVNKISVKLVSKNIAMTITKDSEGKQIPTADGEQSLMRVLGMATAVVRKAGKLPNGDETEHVKFEGDFKATNLTTGEVYRSGVIYLPAVYQNILEAAINSVETGSVVEFAVDIGVKPTKKLTGYEWSVKPLIKETGDSPLAMLESRIESALQLANDTTIKETEKETVKKSKGEK